MQTTKLSHPIAIDPELALADLRWLSLAASADSTKSALCRVHVDSKRAVATDGHRLHFIAGSGLPNGFSVRGSDLAIALDLARSYSLQLLELHEGSTFWRFESTNGRCDLTFRIDEYHYPDYESVLPKEVESTELSAKNLRKAHVGEGEKPDYCIAGPGHFNATYIADALRGAPKRVATFIPENDASPVLFRYGNRSAIVMPVRQ